MYELLMFVVHLPDLLYCSLQHPGERFHINGFISALMLYLCVLDAVVVPIGL